MSDYGATNQPWADYKSYITTVDIGSGITHIGSSAFYICTALATVNGGSGVNSIGISAFVSTVWISTISNTDAITYLGHVLIRGNSYTGTAVTVNDGTTAIYENAFNSNGTITSVTIPASMTSIGGEAFYNCTALATVHVLASTPPMLSSYAFYLEDDNKSLARTFNVRSAAYKTAAGWKDIYNKEYDYAGYTGTELRVVSTLALPDGFSTNATPVAIAGTDYYAECTSITLSYTGSASLEGIKVNGSSDGVTNNGNDTFTFTMPAEDVTVSATWLDPHVITSYVDANGNLHENIAAIPLDNTMTTLEAGTYVVNSNVTYTSTVTTTGDVTLILADGCTMSFGTEDEPLDETIMNCQNLTIYGQAQGTGWLKGYINAQNGINTLFQNGAKNYTQHSGNVIIRNGYGSCIYTYNFTLLGGTLDVEGGVHGDIEAWNISILGGQLWPRGMGLYSDFFTLGYTNPTDLIYATSYTSPGSSNPIKIVNGQTLVDENGDTWSDMIYSYITLPYYAIRQGYKNVSLWKLFLSLAA